MAWSLYNKYRPNTFNEVVGQEHVEKTLMNAVLTNTVSHAYLFTGPRGTGKTTTARLLAKALLCEQAPTDHPDGSCEQCRQIAEGTHPDVYELDAASRTGVDNVREEIIGRVHFAPTHGAWKIYIIDEVHMLTTPAFNALLKTLEEPPPQVLFVLCTTDAHKVPPTIQSRCQRFDFRRLSVEQIAARLAYISEQEGYHTNTEALELIARRSQGGMRDAIGALEQVAVYSGGQIDFAAVESMIGEVTADQLFALGDLLAAGDVAGSFDWVADFVLGGTDIALLASDLARHVRNLYLATLVRDNDRLLELLAVGSEELGRYQAQAQRFGSAERLAYVLTVLGDLISELKSAPNARLALEIACTRIIRPQAERSLEALAARVAELERMLASGGGSAGAGHNGDGSFVSREDSGESLPLSPDTKEPSPLCPAPALPTSDRVAADDIHSAWPRVIEAIKKDNRSVAMRLSGSRAYLGEDGVIVVELPAGAEFARKTLTAPEQLALVRTALSRLIGTECELRYVVAGDPAPAKEDLAAMLSASLGTDILLEEVPVLPPTELQ